MEGVIYAYTGGRSEAQQEYTARRLAQIASQRRQRRDSELASREIWRADDSQDQSLLLLSTPASPISPSSPHPARQRFSFNLDGNIKSSLASTMMESITAIPGMPNSSSHSEQNHQNLLKQPFELRHGRRYLREVPYPLPCDLTEIQRQNLRTLLACQIFGRPICSPNIQHGLPVRVLEVGCGGGYWSAMCHDYFSSLGFGNVSFTGIDLAPLAPDYRRQGMDWTFIQHDLRRMPLPFDDGEFDFVMVKDLSLAVPQSISSQRFVDECIRVLRVGGSYEVWEFDHLVRKLLPHPPQPPTNHSNDQDLADATGTYLIAPGTPFTPAQNKYLRQANRWLDSALSKRRLLTTPCARIAQLMLQETETLCEVGWRRIAIPLSEMWWEHEDHPADSPMSFMHHRGKEPQTQSRPLLTTDQLALRKTALITVLQQIESLEPLMKEASGKNADGWAQWKASMMANILDPDPDSATPALTGEALEMGAWWATKLGHAGERF
nr:hypothetical protein CFP56_39003 [Quercus suber]